MSDLELLQTFMDEELAKIKNTHDRIIARCAWIAATQKLNQVRIERILSQFDNKSPNQFMQKENTLIQ